MSEQPSYLNRAVAISAAAAVATVALTVGVAAEIANNLHPAVTVVGATTTGSTAGTTSGTTSSTTTGSMGTSTTTQLAPAQVAQAPVGGSHGS
jgi:hypothetical protein